MNKVFNHLIKKKYGFKVNSMRQLRLYSCSVTVEDEGGDEGVLSICRIESSSLWPTLGSGSIWLEESELSMIGLDRLFWKTSRKEVIPE